MGTSEQARVSPAVAALTRARAEIAAVVAETHTHRQGHGNCRCPVPVAAAEVARRILAAIEGRQPADETGRRVRTHECVIDGCTEQVPLHMLMCGPDWWKVPNEVRNRYWSAQRRRYQDWDAFEAAVEACKEAAVRPRPAPPARPVPPARRGPRPRPARA
ncbi:hypothetical protein F5972_07995 [Microbispora cellulosiformans]|uniref:Uncharacterized protein n=1 Tax=Microbispora cellulosiformans TaxID=2614688 RepID=A0A5J5K833_9ACTN|nr:hypothetical protein [Microbispora cellulosiformans]KAA9379589.1 hypothetical protein F5972_07995 [Microbispora cellulosiformans]